MNTKVETSLLNERRRKRTTFPEQTARWATYLVGTVTLFAFLFPAGCNDTGSTVGPPPAVQDGVLYDLAGQADARGDDGDDGPALEALLYWPMDITSLPTGELLVMDWNNHRIRMITPDGIIRHYIGSGQLGDIRVGDATQARFNHPTEIKVGPDGTYWISAFHNWCIKNVDPVTLTIIQVLGDTTRGFRGDYPENGGSIDAVAKPRFDLPSSVTFDPAGNLYFCDQGNTRIRKIDLQTRVIETFVGRTRGWLDGADTTAQFAFPGAQTVGTGERGGGMDISPDGEHIYVADTENNRIRMINIATRMVTTIAGTGESGYSGDGGPALSAQLNFPSDLACASNGDIYVADAHNHAIRKIDAAGTITTVAGTGVPGFSPNGTLARSAMLSGARGVAYDNDTKTLYIADTYNHQIKMVRNP